MNGDNTKKDEANKCWEFFDCLDEIRKHCKVFVNWEKEAKFCEGWLYYDNNSGGPAGNGPCHTCSFTKSRYKEMGLSPDKKE